MWRFCLFLPLLIPCTVASAATVSFDNAQWRVRIDPSTLAIDVTPAHGPTVQASRGVAAHRVAKLQVDATAASWQWDDGAWRVMTTLSGRDLSVRIEAREAGDLDFLDQPASAFGRGLIFPLAEGHYVPRGDTLWRTFLLEHMAGFDTNQDLSLPLWGMDHGAFSLHWLLPEPFGNRLQWRADGDALALGGRHRFSPLATATPLVIMLHLAGDDPLAGAKRYRQWLIDQDRFEPLSAKIAATPDTAKLPGASHLYLWGGGLLAEKDIADWDELRRVLRGEGPLTSVLANRFDTESREVLDARVPLNRYQRSVLVRALNQALDAEARAAWQVDKPDPERMVARYGELRDDIARMFGKALKDDPAHWGGGVSLATIARLRAAGLRRLWVGLGESWEPGLWHPEAIKAGVAAGYLMAPYDSYATALAPGDNPDWTSAHLGRDVYERCAVMREDGSLKSGFLGNGHYTDTGCVMPLMQRRVAAVQRRAGFNSWFLDAWATGMLFESYRPGATMTYARNAEDNVSAARWITSTLGVPTGSEDGNAAVSGAIVFAHGMQTPVIGWSDPDVGQGPEKNPDSPYFLGTYWPPEQPSAFFRQVPTKPLYRHIHFAPQTRLPLHQTVFHDAIVTSHHWHTDNLKLGNVRRENELAQLLYNVPPLYHLSAGTLEERLPAIVRMDAFFQPLHRRLATQALTGFRWVSRDRLVQETRFADGSTLRANFSARDYGALPAYTIVATDPDGTRTSYRSTPSVD
jgi:hypothetical protein